MSNYYLHIVALINCPYSNASIELVKDQKFKSVITKVDNNNKDNYKTDDIDTFPQIYLKKNNNPGSLLLGGHTELKKFFDTFHVTEYKKENVDKFIEQNTRWTKKPVLRLIELINNK